ncbi:MAG: ferrous iron transport protein B [Bacteroidaceae bacterium]|nr:ferrous iron transport protein B [Bacteroidaceae bacterium]
MTLRDLKIGQTGLILRVNGEGALRQHFLDLGVIPLSEITLVKYAPMGDPLQVRIHGYELTLRLADAANIEVCLEKPEKKATVAAAPETEHPGLGEGGYRFHDSSKENPLPKDTKLTFALVGNQNCGKTTLFNQLTNSNQHVGNFPGVTVERKSGVIKNYPETEVTDLPGIYSLSPFSSEEIVSRQFVLDEHPKGIINIVDATNIERNLYLSMQLLELGIPMVLALNMMDELKGNGGTIRMNEMESMLGIPVVAISALKNEGVNELVEHVVHVARYQESPQRQDFCSPEQNGGAVHRCLHSIMHLIEDHAERAHIPVRFAATKLVEGDQLIQDALKLEINEKQIVEKIIRQMEEERGLDRAAAIADMRFSFIQHLCEQTVVKPKRSKEQLRSIAIDKVLTGKWTALPAFILIMAFVFWFTFADSGLGVFLQDLLQEGIDYVTELADQALTSLNVNDVVHSLVIDGIFGGVGSVLSFVPLIIVLFFFLSLLEDSGYMARIAFVTDKLLRKIGLSGRSIVPMLIGFGCSVPSVMSTRTLPSERDRKLTILLIPFMSCTAKVPIYGFFCAALFPHHAGVIMLSLYLIGIVVGVLIAYLSKLTTFKGEATPFVMELPCYRMPAAKNVCMLLWEKARDFIMRAFTVIFLATILIWFLQTFDFTLNVVSEQKDSILALISSTLVPLFQPLGLGDWRIITAFASGFMAKESVVSTLEVLYSGTAIDEIFDFVSGYTILIFCLLYTPCVAAVASIRRELGTRWAFIIVIFQCLVAWICSFLVHGLLSMFMN